MVDHDELGLEALGLVKLEAAVADVTEGAEDSVFVVGEVDVDAVDGVCPDVDGTEPRETVLEVDLGVLDDVDCVAISNISSIGNVSMF